MPASASAQPRDDIAARVRALVPDLERYVTTGMAAFDVPGTAVGVVGGDRLLYAKGFGQRRKGSNAPVGTKTVFQIGSTTKAFLAATLAIAVDRKKLKWDDRVVDLDPAFSLKDPALSRSHSIHPFPTWPAPPATSMRASRIARAGCDCRSETGFLPVVG